MNTETLKIIIILVITLSIGWVGQIFLQKYVGNIDYKIDAIKTLEFNNYYDIYKFCKVIKIEDLGIGETASYINITCDDMREYKVKINN